MQNDLTHLAGVFSQITDPRSKLGTYLPCAGILALVFLGLLAGQNYLTHIRQWAKNHWKTLKTEDVHVQIENLLTQIRELNTHSEALPEAVVR